MPRTFKALSVLLSYPTEELRQSTSAIRQCLAEEGLLTDELRSELEPLLLSLEGEDLYSLQERYVLLFDRTRALSLHLFEHVHGESRDRGQALVDLAGLYDRHGYAVATRELPDYLPLFLEFLSMRPLAEARRLLGHARHIIVALKERLRTRDSLYAAPFAALEALADVEEAVDRRDEILAFDDVEPDDLHALDLAWEEEPVTFGPSAAAGCGPDRLAARLRAARRDVTKSQNGESGS